MSDVTVRVLDHSSLMIEGPVTVLDGANKPLPLEPPKPSMAFCRCGASANKPFCDGSHRSSGFQSAVLA